MTVLQIIKNFFTEESELTFGLAHSGSFNVESGFAEIKSQHFPACETCRTSKDLVRTCKNCGRAKGNNFQFLAGRGDGVYSGITFYDGVSRVMGFIYVFDENNGFASATSSQLTGETLRNNTFQDDLIGSLKDYFSCEAFEAGSIRATFQDTRDVGLIVADSHADLGSRFATVDHPLADGDYKVYLFMEPILNIPTAPIAIQMGGKEFDFNRGYADAQRPRALFVVHKQFESKALKNIRPQKVNWDKQAEVWAETLVMSNASGNSGQANAFNGLAWLGAANDQQDFIAQNPANEEIWYLYATRAFGFFIQAALCGSEDGLNLALEQASASLDGSILTEDVLRDAVDPRGLSYGPEILSIFGSSISEPVAPNMRASFCKNCGNKFDEEAKFCQSCGTHR